MGEIHVAQSETSLSLEPLLRSVSSPTCRFASLYVELFISAEVSFASFLQEHLRRKAALFSVKFAQKKLICAAGFERIWLTFNPCLRPRTVLRAGGGVPRTPCGIGLGRGYGDCKGEQPRFAKYV